MPEQFLKEIRKTFPNFSFRPYQRETINAVIKAFFIKGYDNVLIDMPTGGGKSIINYIIARHFNDAWYTTPQIILLDQLEKDKLIQSTVPGVAVIKGRDKYICPYLQKQQVLEGFTLSSKDISCAVAPCVTNKDFYCTEQCPYQVARENALDSPISALSFAFLILTRNHPDWGQRDLLIVDEGDDLESWATEFGTLVFRTPERFDNIFDVIRWAKSKLNKTKQEIRFLEDLNQLSIPMLKKLENLKKLEAKLELFLEDAENNPQNWTFRKSGSKLEVKPLNAGGVLNRLVWWRGKKRLITSGTIINGNLFRKHNGLPGKTLYIRVPHTFPVENRPIIYTPVGKMTKDERSNTYNNLIDKIHEIIDNHPNDNILIHCHSYEIAQEISKRLDTNRRVIIHDSSDREDKLQEFINSKNSILISVGFSRGVDLKYDLCRCQIITKIPYPDISDIRVQEIWVKRRNWKWARYQAIKNLVQMAGRIVRAEDDYGITYILDSSFENLKRYKSEFPSWFLEAVQYPMSPDSTLIT